VSELATLRILANGFIVTSLLWASILAAMIDRRLWRAASLNLLAALFTLFGLIHSPEPGSPIFLPWQISESSQRFVHQFALGYLIVALLLFAWGCYLHQQGVKPIDEDTLPLGDHSHVA
jgi:adenine/guanine/hypoxanthine permease